MASSTELDIADDIDASAYFSLPVINNGVTLKVSEPFTGPSVEQSPRRCLFAISSTFGIAVAATTNGFAVFALSTLRQAYTEAKQRTQASPDPLRQVHIGDGGITFLRFGMADKVVIASGPATQGSIFIWRLKSLVDGSSTSPVHTFPPQASDELLDILPNPSDRPELLALLYRNGSICMVNMEAKSTTGTFGQQVTAACWSVKGKQIVCGDTRGTLTQYTPEGDAKTLTEAPPSLRERSMHVLDIRWIENAVFFATYVDSENSMDTAIFVSTRAKDGGVTYSPILDPLMVETMDRPESRYNVWLKSWNPFKHLLLVCNATSNTVGHVGLGPVEEGNSADVWSSVNNGLYTTLPLETYSVGLDIDLSNTEPPPQDENIGNTALPLLWAYASDGSLSAWRVSNKAGEQYPGIVASKDVTTQEDAGSAAATVSTSTRPSATPSEAAAPTAAGSPFAFGGGSTSFGNPGSFASPPAFGKAPAFGRPPSFAPAFGQSAFGSGSQTPSAFGKPAFGQTASGSATPSSAGGFASFSAQPSGFTTPAAASASVSPFASGTSTPAEKPVFAAPQPTTFGFSTLGSSSASTSSPFGTTASGSGFATPSFGQNTGFGSVKASGSPFAAGTKNTSGTFGEIGDKRPPTSSFSGGIPSTSSTGASAPGSVSSSPFGVTPASSFSALRSQSPVEDSKPDTRPPGLAEEDAEAMEPEKIANQAGGAFDFEGNDSDDDQATSSLALGKLAFTSKADNVTPKASPFGAIAKPSAFSVPSQPSKTADAVSGVAAFSFAKPAGSPAKDAFASRGSGTATPSEDKSPANKASGVSPAFGQSAFGKPSSPDQPPAFGQASSFGKPSTFGTPSAFGQPASTSPSFSFGKSTGEASSSSGFAGFASSKASPSASPFAASPSPSPSPSFSLLSPATFAKPGLFGNTVKKPAAHPVPEQRPAPTSPTTFGAQTTEPESVPATHEQQVESASGEEALQNTEAGHSNVPSETHDSGTSDGEAQTESDEPEDHIDGDEDVAQATGPPDRMTRNAASQSEEDQMLNDYLDEEGEDTRSTEDEESEENVTDSYGQPAGSEDELEDDGNEEGDNEENYEETESDEDEEQEPEVHERKTHRDFIRFATSERPEVPEQTAKSQAKVASQQTSSTPVLSRSQDIASAAAGSLFSQDSTPKASTSNLFAAPAQPSPSTGPAPMSTTLASPTPVFSFNKPSEGPRPFGFSNLQKATPRTSSPLASLPVFAPPASPSQTQSSFDLSGLSSTPSSPSASPVKTHPPLEKTQRAPALVSRSQLGDVPQMPAKQVIPERSQSAETQVTSMIENQKLPAPPKLSSSLPKGRPAPQVSQETLSILINMQEHLDALKESASACLSFFHSVQPSRLPKNVQGDVTQLLAYEGPWGMGDLPYLLQITKGIARKLSEVSQRAKEEEKASRALEGALLKTKAKSEEINRYIRARDDPEVAKMVRVRQLGPEQLENQARIRRQSQNVNEALDELDHTVSDLKNKVLEEKLGRTPLQAPSLDAIYRSIRNVTSALQRKLVDLDDIGLRLDMMTLSTASPARGFSTTPRKSTGPLVIKRDSPSRPDDSQILMPFDSAGEQGIQHISRSRIQKSVQRSLAADEMAEKLRAAWLSGGRKKPLLNTSANQ